MLFLSVHSLCRLMYKEFIYSGKKRNASYAELLTHGDFLNKSMIILCSNLKWKLSNNRYRMTDNNTQLYVFGSIQTAPTCLTNFSPVTKIMLPQIGTEFYVFWRTSIIRGLSVPCLWWLNCMANILTHFVDACECDIR